MYRAELHGKLSPKVENSEDMLTSNVFSFFMYSDRDIFLKEYLEELGFRVSSNEVESAEFIFWPYYDDYTQPDVVLLVGDKYLLFEAKYLSDYGKETERLEFQPSREIYGGLLDAKNLGKTEFKFIAITADYCYQGRKLEHLDKDQLEEYVIWTNWQKVASCVRQVLESDMLLSRPERLFASDLLELLEKKKLRSYEGKRLFAFGGLSDTGGTIFLDSSSVRFRGEFTGFIASLEFETELVPIEGPIFLRQ
ncbi:MAG: hypothetical protein KJ993_13960 [Actinobacteria bacterium]|nr:hypothetical protein [Actinomycetota bacterium]